MVLLVVAAAIGGAWRKPIDHGFDEVAHVSHAATLQSSPAWPDFATLRILDPATFRFTSRANYLNHPPPSSGLIAAPIVFELFGAPLG